MIHINALICLVGSLVFFFYLLKVGTVRNCNQNLGNSFIKSACTNYDGINDFQIRKLGLYLSLCMFLFVYLFA